MCNDLEPDVPEFSVRATRESAPLAEGGQLVDGTYYVAEQVLYGFDWAPTDPVGRMKVTISGSEWQEASDEYGFAEPRILTSSASISTSGTGFLLQYGCPAGTDPFSASFTAGAEGFVLYFSDNGLKAATVFARLEM
jgi:hypothetical protein